MSTLSGGQRRRLDIAMGLIHAPDLLFLDEPSTGLDPQNRANLQEHIVALRERHGTTIVLTTHYLDEADALAERVVVIDHGRIIADDTPERLKADHAGDRITLGFASTQPTRPRPLPSARRRHPAQPSPVRATASTSRVAGGAAAACPACCATSTPTASPSISAEVARPTLDDVFLDLTGRSLREGADAAPSSDRPPPPPTTRSPRMSTPTATAED